MSDGLYLDNANNNTIQNNYIGVDASGLLGVGNAGTAGVRLTNTTSNAVVRDNLVSSNATGIYIDAGAALNQVLGNLIGTDKTGTADLGNSVDGVRIASSASLNAIGGTTAADRNIISGNDNDGVKIDTTSPNGNTVQGNYIGTDKSGTGALANAGDGVEVISKLNTIGGTTTGAGNVISGNIGDGVLLSGAGATGNMIVGNYVGTDSTGSAAIGNAVGILVAGANGNAVGGATGTPGTGLGNVVSGNVQRGIELSAANNNTIEGNLVGTAVSGTNAVGQRVDSRGRLGLRAGYLFIVVVRQHYWWAYFRQPQCCQW